jgi:hypothetical protein
MIEDESNVVYCSPKEYVMHIYWDRQRGQPDASTILKVITGGIVAVPLAISAGDIQSQLAAVSGFSGLLASLITLLIISTILAAAFREA